MNWKFFVRLALPYLEMAAEYFADKDENDIGQDDMIAISLRYAKSLIEAAINGTTAPKAPEALR